MLYFHNDYCEGCHPKILEGLVKTNLEQTPGYGMDDHCLRAAEMIRAACGKDDVAVHFLVGGTQTNLTVIDAALRPHQGVLCADTGHIHVHETGAVEATGHKVLALPSENGKVSARQVTDAVKTHRQSESFEHEVQPKLVYISHPTELGTLYTLQELEELSRACRENGLYLFLDGARLGYGLVANGSDVALSDIARLCDVFYIGGTKVGALFGEAVVISNPALGEDFRYLIKQHGGMLAKGRLLGIQFEELFTDDLYFRISEHGVRMADRIRATFDEVGTPYFIAGVTNQIFPILSDDFLQELGKSIVFTEMDRVDDTHRAIRICTSWASTEENVDTLCREIRRINRMFTGC